MTRRLQTCERVIRQHGGLAVSQTVYLHEAAVRP
jgi:hypothetical protein